MNVVVAVAFQAAAAKQLSAFSKSVSSCSVQLF